MDRSPRFQLLVASVLLASTASVSAATGSGDAGLGASFLVNESPDLDQTAPEVASGPDGGFMVVWKEDQLIGGVFGRMFAADGSAAGGQFAVGPDPRNQHVPRARERLAVATDPRGGFGAVWDELSRALVGRVFDAEGRPGGPAFEIAIAEGGGDARAPAVALDDAGRLWATWAQTDGVNLRGYLRSYEPNGEPSGPLIDLGPIVGGSETSAALAVAPDGAVLVAWAQPAGNGASLVGRWFRPEGAISEAFVIRRERSTRLNWLRASAGPSGFALVWNEEDGTFLQALDPSGGNAGALRQVPGEHAPAIDPAVAQDGSGNVFVTWTAASPGELGLASIYGRCFDAAGRPLTDDIAIGADARFNSLASSVAGLPTGGFLVAWEAEFGDGEDSAILARFVAPPSPGMVGFSTSAYHAREGDGGAEISVLRTAGSLGPVTVGFRVRGESAEAGRDFDAVTGELSWGSGETGPRTFDVPIADDARREGEERAVVDLFAPGGGAILGRAEAALVIADDEGLARPGAASRQLTATDVECDRNRLVGLAERIESSSHGVNLALTATGDPFGVLYFSDDRVEVDSVLSFSANAEETPLLRNPERPQLPSVSLTRNELASTMIDQVGRSEAPALGLSLDPTLGGGSRVSWLRIDNARHPDELGRGGRSTDTKPGRGLVPLLTPCHQGLTRHDFHVFRVVARVLRVRAGSGRGFMRAVTYRGEEPGHYRIEVAADRATLELDLFVTFDADGSLLGGILRLREPCPPLQVRGCSHVGEFLSVRLAPPLGSPGAIDFRYWMAADPDVPTERQELTFDWRELLAGTTWRRPL